MNRSCVHQTLVKLKGNRAINVALDHLLDVQQFIFVTMGDCDNCVRRIRLTLAIVIPWMPFWRTSAARQLNLTASTALVFKVVLLAKSLQTDFATSVVYDEWLPLDLVIHTCRMRYCADDSQFSNSMNVVHTPINVHQRCQYCELNTGRSWWLCLTEGSEFTSTDHRMLAICFTEGFQE